MIKQKKYPCKHRLFVLLEIGFLRDDTVLLQYSYKSHEIRQIVSKLRNHTEVCKGKSKNPLNHSNYESAKSSKDLKLSMAEYTKDNTYEITFLSGLISKCYGCEKTFSPEDKNPPNDIVIRHLEIRPGYNREKNEWFVTKDKKQTNAYYHAKAKCVKLIHSEFMPDLVVLPHSIKLQLSDDHKEKLNSSGFIIQ